MKILYLIPFCLLLFTNCSNSASSTVNKNEAFAKRQIPNIDVVKSALILNQIEAKWYYKGKPYSGYSVKFHANDTLAERIGFQNGKREGIAREWSGNGAIRVESYYKYNRLDSIYKTYWESGVLSSHSNYIKGVKQGVEKEWYASGKRAKLRQLIDGQESGLQQAWLENGTLYINYEARNGRIFGMLKSNSCYQLENEKINRDEKI